MMRKSIIFPVLVIVSVAIFSNVASASADGVIIPDNHRNYPVIEYHNANVTIEGQHAVTKIDQKFCNPSNQEMVGTYIFPVPEGAFVSNFKITIDGREYQAESMGKEEAKEFFEKAVENHNDVSLLEYIDQNLFKVRVKIPPKGHRKMSLRYEEFIVPWGGMYRYAYTLSTERYSSKDIENVSVTVNLSSEKGVQNVYSPTHNVEIERKGSDNVQVQYLAHNVRPKKDFELYYSKSENSFGAGGLSYFDGEQGFFLFTFSPNPEEFEDSHIPKDIVFVTDKSGSMSGEKIEQTKDALKFILQKLGEEDRFTVTSFNSKTSELSSELMPVNNKNLSKALSYVDNLGAGGSTNINGTLLNALSIFQNSSSETTRNKTIVFLTDGKPTSGVTNEDQIATNIENANSSLEVEVSIHVFGVGYNVNTHLLDKISGRNHGSSIYVDPNQSLEEALVSFYGRIGNPIMTDVNIEFSGVNVSEVYPKEAPDLFEGSQIVLVGKYSKTEDMKIVKTSSGDSNKTGSGHVTYQVVLDNPNGENNGKNIAAITAHISGETPSGRKELNYEFELNYADYHDFIPKLWATRKIGDLVNQIRLKGETENLVEKIKELGNKYGIVTPYTSMLVKAGSGSAQANMDDNTVLQEDSGASSFMNAKANKAYESATRASVSRGANIKSQGGKTFINLDGTWIDMSLLSGVTSINLENQTSQGWIEKNINITENVSQNSSEYFNLAGEGKLGEVLATGENVVFSHEGEVVRVSSGLENDEEVSIVSSSSENATPISALLASIASAGGLILLVIVRIR